MSGVVHLYGLTAPHQITRDFHIGRVHHAPKRRGFAPTEAEWPRPLEVRLERRGAQPWSAGRVHAGKECFTVDYFNFWG